MRHLTRALAATLLLLAAPQAASGAALRIAAPGAGAGACHPLEKTAAPGESAYYKHLAKRLDVDILKCPVKDRLAAAQALAAGKADMAMIDTAAYEPVKSQVRAFMTVRSSGPPARVPVVLSTLKASGRDLASLEGRTIVFGGAIPASHEVPKQALADKGMGGGFFGREIVAEDYQDAVKILRSGKADAMILHASAQRRLCRGATPKAQPCADLAVLWTGRARAPAAFAVRRDMPDLVRYQILGIHLAMHMEAQKAFAWAAGWAPSPVEFEPTEAEALAAAR